jgi:hypothetical protein
VAFAFVQTDGNTEVEPGGGAGLIVIQGVGAQGCTFITGTSPSDVFVNVQYVMR